MTYSVENLEKTVVRSESGRWFGRAVAEELADGTWVLMYQESDDHPDTKNQIHHIRFSQDGGRTWTPENTTPEGNPVEGFPSTPPGAELGETNGPGDPMLYLCPNGDLVYHCWHVDYGSSSSYNGTWQRRSTDGGRTWSDIFKVDFQGISRDDDTFATEDYFVLDGTIYAGCRTYMGSAWRTSLIESSDNGATWSHVGDITTTTENATEPGIEYLGGEEIVAVTNTKDRSATYLTRSTDMGVTWETPTAIDSQTEMWDRPRIWTPSHIRNTSHVMHYPEWWTEDVVIGIGDWEQSPGSGGMDRVNALWISEDRGQTWSGPNPLDSTNEEDAGYGNFLMGRDGRIVVISYQGVRPSCEIRMYEFELANDNVVSGSVVSTSDGIVETDVNGVIQTI